MRRLASALLAISLLATSPAQAQDQSEVQAQEAPREQAERKWALTLFGRRLAASLPVLMTRDACTRAARAHRGDRSVPVIRATCTDILTGEVRPQ